MGNKYYTDITELLDEMITTTTITTTITITIIIIINGIVNVRTDGRTQGIPNYDPTRRRAIKNDLHVEFHVKTTFLFHSNNLNLFSSNLHKLKEDFSVITIMNTQ